MPRLDRIGYGSDLFKRSVLLSAIGTLVLSVVLYKNWSRPSAQLSPFPSYKTPANMSNSALFQPIRIGDITLSHRVVLAPLTRYRNDDAHVPTDLGVEYYTQRASVSGTLLITEATYVSGQASGQPNAPGFWTDAQISSWKKVSSLIRPPSMRRN